MVENYSNARISSKQVASLWELWVLYSLYAFMSHGNHAGKMLLQRLTPDNEVRETQGMQNIVKMAPPKVRSYFHFAIAAQKPMRHTLQSAGPSAKGMFASPPYD